MELDGVGGDRGYYVSKIKTHWIFPRKPFSEDEFIRLFLYVRIIDIVYRLKKIGFSMLISGYVM